MPTINTAAWPAELSKKIPGALLAMGTPINTVTSFGEQPRPLPNTEAIASLRIVVRPSILAVHRFAEDSSRPRIYSHSMKWKMLIAGAIAFIAGFLSTLAGLPFRN